MTKLSVTIDGIRLEGTFAEDCDPGLRERLLAGLPGTWTAVQDSWGGEVLRLTGGRLDLSDVQAASSWYMHPGLLGVNLLTGEMALGYGQGRLMDGRGPLPMARLATFSTNIQELSDWGLFADTRGAKQVQLDVSTGSADPGDDSAGAAGSSQIAVILGGTRATAVLLDEWAPLTCSALRAVLPLSGLATNTIFSGPLVRFWNELGGPNGETPLECRDGQYQMALPTPITERTRAGRGLTVAGERAQDILYPGYLYYLPRRPWRGIRIAAGEATRMGGGYLVPFARFVGDWREFSGRASTLLETGAQRMSLSAI